MTITRQRGPPTLRSRLFFTAVPDSCGIYRRKPNRGVVFGFMAEDWPNPDHELGIKQIIWFALPIMLLVTAMIAPFLF